MSDGSVVETLAVGLCGTDVEIIEDQYDAPPPGRDRLILLGHESLGRVVQAPDGDSFMAGDLVVGLVRKPDPAPVRKNLEVGPFQTDRRTPRHQVEIPKSLGVMIHEIF